MKSDQPRKPIRQLRKLCGAIARSGARASRVKARRDYHTRQAFAFNMGCPALQPQAFWNSGMFCTTPFTRKRPGECGSMLTNIRENSERRFSHHTRPKPKKERCSGG